MSFKHIRSIISAASTDQTLYTVPAGKEFVLLRTRARYEGGSGDITASNGTQDFAEINGPLSEAGTTTVNGVTAPYYSKIVGSNEYYVTRVYSNYQSSVIWAITVNDISSEATGWMPNTDDGSMAYVISNVDSPVGLTFTKSSYNSGTPPTFSSEGGSSGGSGGGYVSDGTFHYGQTPSFFITSNNLSSPENTRYAGAFDYDSASGKYISCRNSDVYMMYSSGVFMFGYQNNAQRESSVSEANFFGTNTFYAAGSGGLNGKTITIQEEIPFNFNYDDNPSFTVVESSNPALVGTYSFSLGTAYRYYKDDSNSITLYWDGSVSMLAFMNGNSVICGQQFTSDPSLAESAVYGTQTWADGTTTTIVRGISSASGGSGVPAVSFKIDSNDAFETINVGSNIVVKGQTWKNLCSAGTLIKANATVADAMAEIMGLELKMGTWQTVKVPTDSGVGTFTWGDPVIYSTGFDNNTGLNLNNVWRYTTINDEPCYECQWETANGYAILHQNYNGNLYAITDWMFNNYQIYYTATAGSTNGLLDAIWTKTGASGTDADAHFFGADAFTNKTLVYTASAFNDSFNGDYFDTGITYSGYPLYVKNGTEASSNPAMMYYESGFLDPAWAMALATNQGSQSTNGSIVAFKSNSDNPVGTWTQGGGIVRAYSAPQNIEWGASGQLVAEDFPTYLGDSYNGTYTYELSSTKYHCSTVGSTASGASIFKINDYDSNNPAQTTYAICDGTNSSNVIYYTTAPYVTNATWYNSSSISVPGRVVVASSGSGDSGSGGGSGSGSGSSITLSNFDDIYYLQTSMINYNGVWTYVDASTYTKQIAGEDFYLKKEQGMMAGIQYEWIILAYPNGSVDYSYSYIFANANLFDTTTKWYSVYGLGYDNDAVVTQN